jgi:bacillolysin
MRKIILTLILITNIVCSAYSQVSLGALIAGTNSNPEFIIFDERLPRSTNAQEILQTNLKLNSDASYILTQQIVDKLGRNHEKYQQYYQGIKVSTGNYNVHYNIDGTIGAINGNYYPIDQFSVNPILGETEVLNEALIAVAAQEYAWQNPQMEQWIRTTNKDSSASFYPTGELLVYPIKDSLDSISYHLGYQFNIIASQPFASEMIIVDALNGTVIEQYSTFSHGAGDACTNYSGRTQIATTLSNNDYILFDVNRNIHTYDLEGSAVPTFTEPDFKDANDMISPNDWTCLEWDTGLNDDVALDAHWGAMMTYDYFFQEHNRDSYDGQGSVLDVYVHHAQGDFAAWFGTSLNANPIVFGMAFGDGNGTSFDALVSLDLIAHEFGHGITQTSSNLLPVITPARPETAPINEGLSDIWGAVVEYWVLNNTTLGFTDPQGDKDHWLLGEEIKIGFDAERSLRDPTGFLEPNITLGNPMADNYQSALFATGELREKSGVMSHWFYLLSDGTGLSVPGIGINDAAAIVYLAQTVYFTESTDYIDARQATLQAAKDLFGSCSLETQTVSEAWDAVGVPVISLASLPIFAACGEINPSNNQPTGIYDGTGYANIVVATPNDFGIVFSGVGTFCNSFTEIVVENGAYAVFKASDKVILEPGFKAEPGSNFKAYIFDCLGAGNYRLDHSGNEEENNQQIETKDMELFSNSEVKIYPNPMNGIFTIELNEIIGENFVEIYNLVGEKVYSNNSLSKTSLIDITNQPKGIYLVKVINGNDVTTQKIVYQ